MEVSSSETPPKEFEDTWLCFLVGRIPPGLHRVEVRGAGFAFLRTRGFCLVHVSGLSLGLPEGPTGVFEWCR